MSARGLPQAPMAAQLDDILTCVHCGFCLPACPTYEVLGDENDSPRGRIYLMRAVAEGRLQPDDPAFALHIDQCLGCRACEPVCPSGVRYGALVEHARDARRAAGGALDRLARLGLKLFFPVRWLQNLVWMALRWLRATRLPALAARIGGRRATPGRLRFALAMLAATTPRRTGALRRTRGTGGRGKLAAGTGAGELKLAHLEGCVMGGLFGHVNRATERVLRTHGSEVTRIPAGLCCGALHAHSGELAVARGMARRVIEAFEATGAGLLVTNSAGCGAAMKEYAEWLSGDPRYRGRAERVTEKVRDVSEWLAERSGPRYRSLRARVAYDAPCHLLHAQLIEAAPLELMRRVPGLDVEALPRADRCCGAAGIYALLRPSLSQDILRRKLQEISDVGAEIVVTGNPGCLMQIGAGALTDGRDVTIVHPIELLDAALEGAA